MDDSDERADDGIAVFRGLVSAVPYSLALWLMMGLACCALAGCGGGDAEPDTPTPGLDCKARPELCR